MSGTRQGTHERSSLSDVQSKSNEDQNTGTALRTRTLASDKKKRYGGVDRLRVLLLVHEGKSSKDGHVLFVFLCQLGRNCSRGKPDFRLSLVPGIANVCVIAPMRRKIHHFRSKQSAALHSSHGTPSDDLC